MNLKRTPIALLFNPFTFVAGGQALAAGLLVILLSGWVGHWSAAHFDGVLDAHVGWRGPLWFALAEGVIDWLCMTVILLVAGKLISTSAFRVIDLTGTQALARWPMLLVGFACMPEAVRRFGEVLIREALKPKPQINFIHPDAFIFFAVSIAIFICTGWMVVLMYQSFSISCNVRGRKAILTFIVSLLLAEVLSKVAIWQTLLRTGAANSVTGG